MTIIEKIIPTGENNMPSIPIITEREISERKTSKKVEKLPVFNLETGNPQNIYPTNATAYDIPVEAISSKIIRSPVFRDTVIIDIRKRLIKAKEQVTDCNVDTLNAICRVTGLANIQSRYLRDTAKSDFELLIKDINKLQKDFIYICKAIPIEDIRGDIEIDIKGTFRAMNIPMNPEDRMEMFSFYLSGLMKGYMNVFENMKIEFGFPLIDSIMTIFTGYEKGDTSASDAWRYIAELFVLKDKVYNEE